MEDQKLDEQKTQDRFTSLMFGSREDHNQREHHQEAITNQPNIDFDELLVNVDTLLESVKGLKPLFQNVYPFIQKFLKKE